MSIMLQNQIKKLLDNPYLKENMDYLFQREVIRISL